MRFSVNCECGKSTEVRKSMAGIAIQCPHCGERLEIPSLRVLQDYAKRDLPAPCADLDETQTDDRVGADDETEIPESLFVHFCGKVGSKGRVSSSAYENYGDLVSQTVDRFAALIPASSPYELMLSCAILPNDKKLVLVETSPNSLDPDLCERLRRAAEQIQTPPVQQGPVAFVVYRHSPDKRVHQISTRPFAPYHRSIQAIGVDKALMHAAGLSADHLPDVSSQSSASRETLIGKVKRFFAKLFPPQTQAEANGSSAPNEDYEATKTRVEAVEQYFAMVELEQLVEAVDKDPSNVDYRIALAAKHVAQQDWIAAIENYDAAIRLTPSCTPLYGRRAGVHAAADNFQSSLADWNRAIELSPEEPWFYVHRSGIYAELEALPQMREDVERACELAPREPLFLLTRAGQRIGQGDLQGGKEDLQLVLDLDPNSGRGHEQMGWIHLQADFHDPSLAIDHLSRAIELMPHAIDARIHRSLTYAGQNKFELALEDCEKAIENAPESPAGYGAKGRVLQMRGDFPEAIECCSKAIELGLEIPMVLLARGFSYAATDQLELALLDSEAALEMDPDHPLACQLHGMLNIQRGELDSAMEALMKARDAAPDWPEPREQIALLHRMNENPEAAIEEQSILISKQPRHAGHFVNRAFAYTQSGDYDKAREDYDHACKLEPENEQILYLRGCFLMDREQYEPALRDFDRVIELTADNDDARYRRAALLLRLKRCDEALVEYETLVARHPDDPNAYTGRACAHQMVGDEKAAQADLDRLSQIEPEKSDESLVHSLCAKVSRLESEERYDEAIEVAEEVIALIPDEATGYRLRAWMYWYNEQFVEAFDDYSRLLEKDPDNLQLLNARGQVQAEMGEWQAALDDLDRAIDLGREAGQTQLLGYALNGRSFALAGIGRMDDSKRDFEESIQLCPSNAWAHYNRGIVLYQQGEIDEARERLLQALDCNDPPLSKRKRARTSAVLTKLYDETSGDDRAGGGDPEPASP